MKSINTYDLSFELLDAERNVFVNTKQLFLTFAILFRQLLYEADIILIMIFCECVNKLLVLSVFLLTNMPLTYREMNTSLNHNTVALLIDIIIQYKCKCTS